MPTNTRIWKKTEGRSAALFGARRQVLSGSSGRDDRSRSDSTHSRLFIETKYRAKNAVRTLFDETKVLARKEGKTPVVMLADRGRPGLLVCIHSDDLPAVAAEFALANQERFQEAIREAKSDLEFYDPPSFDEAA